MDIYPLAALPNWLNFPLLYLRLIKEEKTDFLPWWLSDRKDIEWRLPGLKARYPHRSLFPFARKDRTDEVACWDELMPGRVVIIYDYDIPGFEAGEIFENFEEWYKFALSEQDDEC